VAIDVGLRPAWDAIVNDALAEATLTRPNFHGYVTEGKVGLHSEHLGFPARRDAEPRPRPPRWPLVMSTATERVWAALEALTDPEIPVVTLRELGILRR
jgi:hypothetical protein